MKSMAGADFPVVLANIATEAGAGPRDDKTLFKPYVILDRMVTDGAARAHAIKVGIIGFVPPQIMNWDRKHLEGNVTARDIVDTAEAYVPEMREAGRRHHHRAVAFRHRRRPTHTDGMENASVPLAAVDGHRRDHDRPQPPGVPGRDL